MNDSVKKLFVLELSKIYLSEDQLVRSIPRLIEAAESPELKEALQDHLTETKEQIVRLEKIFDLLNISRESVAIEAVKGLLAECYELIQQFDSSPVRDAALIAGVQRIEHYEMALYNTLRTFAKELDLDEVKAILQESLDEEDNADRALMRIAEGGLLTTGINRQAVRER